MTTTTDTLEAAYRRHADELIRYATTMVGPDEASDVVTDAMVGVFADRDMLLDPERELGAIDNLRAYLFRAVHHRIVDLTRSQTRRRRREEVYARRWATTTRPTDPSIDARAALAELSEQQRAVTFLTYWSDLTPADIAITLDVSEGSVRKQLARARARLREVLDA